MVGLLVGVSIIQAFGWHATFLVIVPFSILVTLLISKIVKENTRSGQSHKSIIEENAPINKRKAFPVDINGILALSATISFFLNALTLIQIGVNNENLSQIAGAFLISVNFVNCVCCSGKKGCASVC